VKKGLVHIYTGDGKGKTTAAMGLAFRASGYAYNICILQFLKARNTGEKLAAKNINDITYKRANTSTKFTIQMNEQEKNILKKEINISWNKLKQNISENNYDLLILDEIMAVINNNFLSVNQLENFINEKPRKLEVIMTGRKAPQELIEVADYVTEMKLIKHPFSKNIKARKGIEF